MRERELGGLNAVVSLQNPSATPLFHRVQSIASHGLGNLLEKRGMISDQQLAQRAVPADFGTEVVRGHPQRPSPNLHNHSVRRFLSAEDSVQTGHSLVTDRGHLDPGTILHDDNFGNDAMVRKVNVGDPGSGFIENLLELKWNRPQERQETLIFRRGQAG